MYVNRRPCIVGYFLCVIIVLETATIRQTIGEESESVRYGGKTTIREAAQPGRRQSFSVTHDLLTLKKMLSELSQLRQMQTVEAFFGALHKRHQLLIVPSYRPNFKSPAKINTKLMPVT